MSIISDNLYPSTEHIKPALSPILGHPHAQAALALRRRATNHNFLHNPIALKALPVQPYALG